MPGNAKGLAPFKTELRVLVREGDDGYTRALLTLGEGEPMFIALVPSDPHNRSVEVQQKFIELATAVMRQALAEASPGAEIKSVRVLPPGAPTDVLKH